MVGGGATDGVGGLSRGIVSSGDRWMTIRSVTGGVATIRMGIRGIKQRLHVKDTLRAARRLGKLAQETAWMWPPHSRQQTVVFRLSALLQTRHTDEDDCEVERSLLWIGVSRRGRDH